MNKIWYIYILANKRDGVLYVWVTSNLVKRIYEHKNALVAWFTKKYNIKALVYYEECSSIESAIIREKKIKWGNRQKKIELIESINKNWDDLYDRIV